MPIIAILKVVSALAYNNKWVANLLRQILANLNNCTPFFNLNTTITQNDQFISSLNDIPLNACFHYWVIDHYGFEFRWAHFYLIEDLLVNMCHSKYSDTINPMIGRRYWANKSLQLVSGGWMSKNQLKSQPFDPIRASIFHLIHCNYDILTFTK